MGDFCRLLEPVTSCGIKHARLVDTDTAKRQGDGIFHSCQKNKRMQALTVREREVKRRGKGIYVIEFPAEENGEGEQ